MAAESTQRWGIVGLGSQGNAIARALGSVPGVVLTGCLTSSPDRTNEFANVHSCRAYRSDEEFFGAGFDVVVVAGVNSQHARHCVAALEGGSAVLCEKPLALTRNDAARIVRTAETAGRGIFVGYHYRFRALSAEIRDAVQNGEIGEVRDVYMQRTSEQVTEDVRPWRHDLAQAGAGVLCDVGVHLVDFVTWVTGRKAATVSAMANPPRSSGRPDEHVVVSLELDNGALAVVDAARSLPNGDNALQVHGTEGSICTGPLRFVDHFRAEVRRGKNDPHVIESAANKPLLDELFAVRDAYAGTTSERLATAAEGLAGVAVLEGAIQSLEDGGRVTLEDV